MQTYGVLFLNSDDVEEPNTNSAYLSTTSFDALMN